MPAEPGHNEEDALAVHMSRLSTSDETNKQQPNRPTATSFLKELGPKLVAFKPFTSLRVAVPKATSLAASAPPATTAIGGPLPAAAAAAAAQGKRSNTGSTRTHGDNFSWSPSNPAAACAGPCTCGFCDTGPGSFLCHSPTEAVIRSGSSFEGDSNRRILRLSLRDRSHTSPGLKDSSHTQPGSKTSVPPGSFSSPTRPQAAARPVNSTGMQVDSKPPSFSQPARPQAGSAKGAGSMHVDSRPGSFISEAQPVDSTLRSLTTSVPPKRGWRKAGARKRQRRNKKARKAAARAVAALAAAAEAEAAAAAADAGVPFKVSLILEGTTGDVKVQLRMPGSIVGTEAAGETAGNGKKRPLQQDVTAAAAAKGSAAWQQELALLTADLADLDTGTRPSKRVAGGSSTGGSDKGGSNSGNGSNGSNGLSVFMGKLLPSSGALQPRHSSGNGSVQAPGTPQHSLTLNTA